MNNLLTWNFWFSQRPGIMIASSRNILIGLLIFFLLMSVAAFILKRRGGFYTRLWERSFNFFSANLVIGAALYFFNQELVPFLSSRFWYLFWLIGIAIWLWFIVRYVRTLPKRKKEIEKENDFQKYIPK